MLIGLVRAYVRITGATGILHTPLSALPVTSHFFHFYFWKDGPLYLLLPDNFEANDTLGFGPRSESEYF